jgi:hydroxypyruvate reductase
MTAPPAFAHHRDHLDALRAAALQAADPAAAVRRSLTLGDLREAEHVFIVGAGKAGVAMATAAAEVAGSRLAGGVISVPQPPSAAPAGLRFIQGGHPTPTDGSLAAGRAIADLLAQDTPRDRVVAVISGGGSALLDLLRPGLTLADLAATNTALLRSGAPIQVVNAIRRRLSLIKGGGLARLAAPAPVLALILSDVIGNPLDIIASGPTVPPADEPDLLRLARDYDLEPHLPPAVLALLSAPTSQPVPGQAPVVENRLVASNRLAGEAAAQAARGLGFDAHYLADDWQGEAREAGGRFAAEALRRRAASVGQAALVLIVGGETTVTVRGAGRGGRNQEVALAAALALEGVAGVVVSTFGTDGVDGPTDAAGATATGETVRRAQALGLDPRAALDDNDSYAFFAALDDLVRTGPTGTNVNDLTFGLVYRP